MVPVSPELSNAGSYPFINRACILLRDELVMEDLMLEVKLNDYVNDSSYQVIQILDSIVVSDEIKSRIKAELRLVSNEIIVQEGESCFGIVELYKPVCVLSKGTVFCITAMGLRGGKVYGDRTEYQIFKVKNDGQTLMSKGRF